MPALGSPPDSRRPLYTVEERRRRDASVWTLVQGMLAPIQFLVFLISLGLVLRYLSTGEGHAAATLSVVVKTLTLYTIMTMTLYLLPIAYTLFAWWASTGVILYLNGLPRRTHPWTMAGATLLLGVALVGLAATRNDTRITGAYLAFTCALGVWAWQEAAFLLGYVTGPRRTTCPLGSTGWRRAGYALQALAHHELALVVLGLAVLALTWGGANPTGLSAYMIFWVMRQSAKLNVFLGVRNLGEDFLPKHLKYLQTYFRRAPMNALFPVSVALSSWLAMLLWQAAAHGVSLFEATALTFSAALLSLAILEHWFMVLPLPSQALWQWCLRSRATDPPAQNRATALPRNTGLEPPAFRALAVRLEGRPV